MLKRITFLVIVIVLLKPTYDFGLKFFDNAKQFLNDNSIHIQDATTDVITSVSNTAKDTLIYSTATVKNAKLPSDTVRTAEELADAFYYYFSNWQTDFEITYVGSTSDIESLIERAVKMAADRDHYILGHLADRKIEYEYGRFDAIIKVHQAYLTNEVQEQIVNEKVASILASANPETMSDFEKVKFVNDYIVKNTAYGEDTTASPHSANAVVAEGQGVCQGYALLALKLLQDLGIETQYVVGEVYTGGHAWNLVKVDGQWYHLDTTWNDPTPDRKNVVRYEYFLMNDAKMRKDHTWIASDYPESTSTKYAFMAQIDHAYEVDGMIYYSNVNDNNLLYQLNMKTGKTEPLTDSRAQFIVGFGDWLYFSNYSKGAYLSKIRTDGTDETILYKEKVENLFVEDGYLYFSTDGGLKKLEL
ncbi:DUF5050 domain-containing protein [Lysinibacillus sp. BW-2-10]|uniref:transglutaminase domain-containing protein n=1 Tax=Lysinibacillus sp. BW-2-10 TaxID=2590030 RepID=UPI00117CCF5E|nr:DUF5050 domain-containing protein [Lysinibacillus sp. BW-2-10]TSI08349.1 DUF5050 domain-containing protein [Lysinibacillus sp. BW-2-10]